METPEGVVQCDVLVVGGGGAGLIAAIEARARGASVVVATKSRAGRSGNTVVAGGGFSAVVPHEGSEDSPDQHFQDTMVGGKGIGDEQLVRIFAFQAGRRVVKLEEWGLRFHRSGGEVVRRPNPGHKYARSIRSDSSAFPVTLCGLSVTLPLRSTADKMGVLFLDDTPVIRLIVRDGEVCGGLAIDLKRGELVAIAARAVVMACGGAGHIYSDTNNTRGVSGDSYGLLLRAGAALRDMEFVQVYPIQMRSPTRAPVSTSLFADGAVLRNRHGDRFMPRYDPANGDMATRDKMAQGIFYEIQKGNDVGGEVFVDCTAVPESALLTKNATFTRDLRSRGVDPSRDWMKVAPTIHFFMGGGQIDGDCFTGVPGLLAAGEAVGGVHGANRLAGNALAETAVFGAIAGEAAAEYARRQGARPELPSGSLALEIGGGDGRSLAAIRAELRKAMWNGASIARSEASLRSALSTARECAAALDRCPTATLSEAARREETRLMCLTAEAVVLSALARRESRGAHFREDFPSLGDRWMGSHIVRQDGERLEVEFVPNTTG